MENKKINSVQNDIVNLVVKQLKDDVKNMKEGKPCSLCAKWTPTEGDSLDRKTGIFLLLAKALNMSPKNLRKLYNTPLRSYIRCFKLYPKDNERLDRYDLVREKLSN